MRNMLVTNALITDGRAINGVPHLKMRGCWGQAIAWLFLYGERLAAHHLRSSIGVCLWQSCATVA